MRIPIVIAVCISAAFAGIPDGFHDRQYAFHGHYQEKCGNDGFYYKDHYSFVICSNGNAYEQPCAPGSRNSGYDHYHHGNHYYYRDFCDINLVDYGAGIPHGYGHHGYDAHDAGYARHGDYIHEAGYGHHDSGYDDNEGYGHDDHGYDHQRDYANVHKDEYENAHDVAYGYRDHNAGY